jgi:hypothetical protein
MSRHADPGEILETQTGLLDIVPTQYGQGQGQGYNEKQIDEKAVVIYPKQCKHLLDGKGVDVYPVGVVPAPIELV